MSNSEYYGNSPSDIENRIRWKKIERDRWENELKEINKLKTFGNKDYEAKLKELTDLVKARIWEIKI